MSNDETESMKKSPLKFDKENEASLRQLWGDFEKNVGSVIYNNKRLVTDYVLGLEADDYWSYDQIETYAKMMKNEILTGKSGVSLGIHNEEKYYLKENKAASGINGDISKIFRINYFDTIYYQYDKADLQNGTREEIDNMVNVTRALVKDFKKRVIATEYCFFGEKDWAKEVGYRCVHEGGASGALTGYAMQRD
jgi:hypothetical protein